MKIKMTWSGDGLQAGLVYDIPAKKAEMYIETQRAILSVEDDLKEVTNKTDEYPVFEPAKKVKHGNR